MDKYLRLSQLPLKLCMRKLPRQVKYKTRCTPVQAVQRIKALWHEQKMVKLKIKTVVGGHMQLHANTNALIIARHHSRALLLHTREAA